MNLLSIPLLPVEESPCLDKIRNDKAKYDRAVAILKTGHQRLIATPRGDIESELIPCYRHNQQLQHYYERLAVEKANNIAIQKKTIFFDKR